MPESGAGLPGLSLQLNDGIIDGQSPRGSAIQAPCVLCAVPSGNNLPHSHRCLWQSCCYSLTGGSQGHISAWGGEGGAGEGDISRVHGQGNRVHAHKMWPHHRVCSEARNYSCCSEVFGAGLLSEQVGEVPSMMEQWKRETKELLFSQGQE